jgi:hypothetical protein
MKNLIIIKSGLQNAISPIWMLKYQKSKKLGMWGAFGSDF